MSDCNDKVKEVKSPGNKIEYYIEFSNDDEGVQPEHFGVFAANYAFIGLSVLLLLVNLINLIRSVIKKNFDWGHFFLLIVLLLDIFSYGCEIVHM